jgi:uncharacterized protein
MQWRRIDEDDRATYVVILDSGEEAFGTLSAFARQQDLQAAQVSAIGAFERATVGWFDRRAKAYRHVRVDQQSEVLSALGDVAIGPDGPQLHLHVVLGLFDGTTRGGHLLEGHVWPTLEVIVTDHPAHLRKIYRPDLGLALVDLPASPD